MSKNQFVAIRVTSEIVKSLDEVASQQGISRSALIRDLLANCNSFYRFIESERIRQRTDRIVLDGNLSEWVLKHLPEGMTPDVVNFLGEVMHHVAEEMTAKRAGEAGEKLASETRAL